MSECLTSLRKLNPDGNSRLENWRINWNAVDKSAKIVGYSALLALQFVPAGVLQGRLQYVALIMRVRPFFHGMMGLSEAVQLYREGDKEAKAANKLPLIQKTFTVVFRTCFFTTAALKLFPRTQGWAATIGTFNEPLILSLASMGTVSWVGAKIAQQDSGKKPNWSDLGDDGFEVLCTVLEMSDNDGVASAATGLISGACALFGNLRKADDE